MALANAKSDLTLISGAAAYEVHQAIVCPQSPVIKERCAAIKQRQAAKHISTLTKLMKMLTFSHKTESIMLDVTGEEDVAVEAMIHFLYHGDYYPDNYDTKKAGFDGDADFHAAVGRVAKAYGVEKLVVLAKELESKAKGAPQTAMNVPEDAETMQQIVRDLGSPPGTLKPEDMPKQYQKPKPEVSVGRVRAVESESVGEIVVPEGAR